MPFASPAVVGASCVLLNSGVEATALPTVADRALVIGVEVVAVVESFADSVRGKPCTTVRGPAP